MPRVVIPFGAWDYNSPRFDTDALQQARNVIPERTGYRLIRRPSRRSGVQAAGQLANGAHGHLITRQLTTTILRPISDIQGAQWRNEDGVGTGIAGDADFFTSVNEDLPERNRFLHTSNDQPLELLMSAPPEGAAGPTSTSDHYYGWQYRVEASGAWQYDHSWMDGANVVDTGTVSGSGDTDWVNHHVLLSGAEAATITDYTDQRVLFELTEGSASSAFLTSDVDRGDWFGMPGTDYTDLWDLLDDGSDATYIESAKIPVNSTGNAAIFSFGRISRSTDDTWVLTLRARSTEAVPQEISITAEIRCGKDVVASGQTADITTAFQDYTITFLAVDQTLLDSGDCHLILRVVREGFDGTAGARISQVSLSTGNDPRLFISWVRFEIPRDTAVAYEDITEAYIGSRQNIYKSYDFFPAAGPAEWEAVTRTSAAYALATPDPRPWDFCSYGDNVVATNFTDPVQVKGASDTDFDDLITSTDTPKAAHCMVVNNFLVLGNINFTGPPAGQPNEVWWSGLDDIESFAQGDPATGSDRQALSMTPGQITGMMGCGDYGLIFKRDSIIRMDFTGDDRVFVFNVVSDRLGSAYMNSFVRVGNDVFFYTGGSFAVVRGGQYVELIGAEVKTFISSREREDWAIVNSGLSDPLIAGNTIISAYSPSSNLILWLYNSEDRVLEDGEDLPTGATYINGESLLKQAGLIYNVITGAWSRVELLTAHIVNQVIPYSPVADMTTDLRDFALVMYDNDLPGVYRSFFDSHQFHNATITTKELTSQSLAGEPGLTLTIESIRPVYRVDNDGALTADTEVTVFVYDELHRLTTTITSTLDVVNKNGWVGVNASGEAFQFQLRVPEQLYENVTLNGLEVMYTVGGYENS